MSQPRERGGLAGKRKRDIEDLNTEDGRIYKLIQDKGDMGILKKDINKELKVLKEVMVNTKINSCIKSLLGKQMIKEIADMQSKAQKRYLATEFEPSEKVTGGVWYHDGKLDVYFIDTLKKLSLKALSDHQKVATVDGIRSFLKRVVKGNLGVEQVEEILSNLILEKRVVKVKSNGLGEFASFPMGADCYKLKKRGENVEGAMTCIPCGVCPRINQCHPDGIISPTTCEYFTKWLDF